MVLVVLSLGTPPPEWGKYSHGVWKLLTPVVNSMYIKRVQSYRPKTSVPHANTTATTNTAGATSTPGATGTATGTSHIPGTATGTATSTPGATGTTGTATGTTGTATGTATGTTGTPGTTFGSSSMDTPMDISDDEDFAVNCEW